MLRQAEIRRRPPHGKGDTASVPEFSSIAGSKLFQKVGFRVYTFVLGLFLDIVFHKWPSVGRSADAARGPKSC